MQADDYGKFRAIMIGMGEVFGRDIPKTLLDAYWLALRDWSIEDFSSAAGHLIAHAQFMPRPADFTALREAAQPSAIDAWQKAIDHCSSGAYRFGGLDNGGPLDRAAAAAGGYRAIAMHPTDRLHFLQARFEKAYERSAEQQAAIAALPSLREQYRQLVRQQP